LPPGRVKFETMAASTGAMKVATIGIPTWSGFARVTSATRPRRCLRLDGVTGLRQASLAARVVVPLKRSVSCSVQRLLLNRRGFGPFGAEARIPVARSSFYLLTTDIRVGGVRQQELAPTHERPILVAGEPSGFGPTPIRTVPVGRPDVNSSPSSFGACLRAGSRPNRVGSEQPSGGLSGARACQRSPSRLFDGRAFPVNRSVGFAHPLGARGDSMCGHLHVGSRPGG
jgi:hypothetical protein